MTRLIDADKFKENMRYVCDAGGWLEPVTKAVTEYVKKQIDAQPTVDAIPVSFIQQRIDHLQNIADYALDSIGGYIESANSSLYELKLLLSMWNKEQEKQND